VKDVFGRVAKGIAVSMLTFLAGSVSVDAEGVLDDHSFSGMIGPVENPALEGSLCFDNGHSGPAFAGAMGACRARMTQKQPLMVFASPALVKAVSVVASTMMDWWGLTDRCAF